MKPGIPKDARRIGPGVYGDANGIHIDLEELIRETGGDPENPAHRRAAENAARRVAAQAGIKLETREYR